MKRKVSLNEDNQFVVNPSQNPNPKTITAKDANRQRIEAVPLATA
jgi:hypothetical protein